MDAYETKLVKDNVKLARFLARKMWEKAPGKLDLDEITSLAYQGLCAAAVRYKSYGEEHHYAPESYETGEFFSPFAKRFIVGGILEHLRSSDHVPRSFRKDYKAIVAAGYTEGATLEEVSAKTALSVERIRITIHRVESTPVSIDQHFSPSVDNDRGGARELKSETSVESSALLTDLMSKGLVDVVSTLTETQQVVIVLKYYAGLDLQRIAQEMQLGIAPVREAHSSALLKIRERMLHHVKESH